MYKNQQNKKLIKELKGNFNAWFGVIFERTDAFGDKILDFDLTGKIANEVWKKLEPRISKALASQEKEVREKTLKEVKEKVNILEHSISWHKDVLKLKKWLDKLNENK